MLFAFSISQITFTSNAIPLIKFAYSKLYNYICNRITIQNFQEFAFMDLVSRLKRYLDSRQISITQFADECGIPRPTGSQLLAGRNKKVSDEIIGKIHAAYPELNVVWLMFGEGNMVSGQNIETSEPQNAPSEPQIVHQEPIAQTIDFGMDFDEEMQPKSPEKNSEPSAATAEPAQASTTTFTFASPAETPVPASTPGSRASITSDPTDDGADDSITLTTGKGKRVTGIVVYYDDCTYESFIPDPSHGHPFMR